MTDELRRAPIRGKDRSAVVFDKPTAPVMSYRPPREAPAFGEPRQTIIVAYTHVEAYEGELYRCDVCMAVIAKFPPDHPFVDADGLDAFQRHAKWHRSLLQLEARQ